MILSSKRDTDRESENWPSGTVQCSSPQVNVDSYGSETIVSPSNSETYFDLTVVDISALSMNPRWGPLHSDGEESANSTQFERRIDFRESVLSSNAINSGMLVVQRGGAESIDSRSSGLVTNQTEGNLIFTNSCYSGTQDLFSISSLNSGVDDARESEVHETSQRNSEQVNIPNERVLSARFFNTGNLSAGSCNDEEVRKQSIYTKTSDSRLDDKICDRQHRPWQNTICTPAADDNLPRSRRQSPWQQVMPNGRKNLQLLKLIFFATVPALIVIGQNVASLVEDIQDMKSMNTLKENVKLSLEVAKIIHHIQIERGTTALFISSGGEQVVKQRLSSLYKNTDNSVAVLSNLSPNYKLKRGQSKTSLLENLRRFRSSLEPSNLTLRDIIGFYTGLNADLSATIGMNMNVEIPSTYWTELTAFQLLLAGKEQAGIERALGSTYYARGQLPLSDLLWYHEKMMLGVQLLSQSVQYSAYTGSLINRLFQPTQLSDDISEMRDEITRNSLISPSVLCGIAWFDNMTEYINILKSTQDKLAGKIIQHTDGESNKLENRLIASALQLCIVIIMMPVIVYLLKNIANITSALSKRTFELTQEKWQSETLVLELEDEKRRTEEFLYELLPKSVALKLMNTGSALPETFSSVTIMFSDVVDFTRISSCITPIQVVNMLNKLYRTIDGRIEDFDVYKVETIGDGYMVASGLPTRNGSKHVEEIAKLALDLLGSLKGLTFLGFLNQDIRLRIGFHTGPCAAGVVGIKMPRYCIFGDTVNTASRMESTSLPMHIQMTQSSALVLKRKQEFQIKERGQIEVKGKGLMRTFWLEGVEKP